MHFYQTSKIRKYFLYNLFIFLLKTRVAYNECSVSFFSFCFWDFSETFFVFWRKFVVTPWKPGVTRWKISLKQHSSRARVVFFTEIWKVPNRKTFVSHARWRFSNGPIFASWRIQPEWYGTIVVKSIIFVYFLHFFYDTSRRRLLRRWISLMSNQSEYAYRRFGSAWWFNQLLKRFCWSF